MSLEAQVQALATQMQSMAQELQNAQATILQQGQTINQQANALQLTQQQLVAQQQANAAAAAAAAVAPPPVVPPVTTKPVKPNVFTGSPKSNAHLWIAELKAYFNAAGINGNARTVFAIAQLKENALLWATSVPSLQNPSTVDFDQFETEFITRFSPITGSKQARSLLYVIKQTGSLANYMNEYLSLMARIPDLNDEDRCQKFIHGLRPALQMECMRSNVNTLPEAMALAQRLDAVQQMVRPYQNQQPRYANAYNRMPFYGRQYPTSNGSSNRSDRMDLENINLHQIDANDGGKAVDNEDLVEGETLEHVNNVYQSRRPGGQRGNGRRNMSPAEYEAYKKTRKCYHCQQVGHIRPDCPQLRRTSTGGKVTPSFNSSKNVQSQHQH
jgi:DNA-binding protein H-NS